jgi:hypothetical protein
MSDGVVQFHFEAPSESKPYLGQVDVVQDLVFQFSREVMDIRHAFFTGKPGGQDAVAQIEALARHHGAIFTGQDLAYAPAPWNTPGRLGNVLRVLTPEAERARWPQDPATGFFVYVAQIVIAACVRLERGESEQRVGPQLQAALDSVVDRILAVK